MHTDINSKVSFQVIPAVLEAIKDAEYEGTYIRPVSIQLINIHILLIKLLQMLHFVCVTKW